MMQPSSKWSPFLPPPLINQSERSVWYEKVFIVHGGSKGHGGTYWDDNGGEFARVAVAWLKCRLMGDKGPHGAQMFEGDDCGLCNTEWIIKKKNMD